MDAPACRLVVAREANGETARAIRRVVIYDQNIQMGRLCEYLMHQRLQIGRLIICRQDHDPVHGGSPMCKD